MKKYLPLLNLTLALLLLLFSTACNKKTNPGKIKEISKVENNLLLDQAQVLSEEHKTQLISRLNTIDSLKNIQIKVITNSDQAMVLEEKAIEIFEQNQQKNKSLILVYINPNQEAFTIQSANESWWLTKTEEQEMIQQMNWAIKEKRYFTIINKIINRVGIQLKDK